MRYLYLIIIFLITLRSNLAQKLIYLPDSIVVNVVKSKYQKDTTVVYTLATKIEYSGNYYLIFLLPVEKMTNNPTYGSAIKEVKKLIDSVTLKSNIIFIQPEFLQVPWYGNHPVDTGRWQENYLLELIQMVKTQLLTQQTKIYLLGFSKSGWGAMSFLFNHADIVDGIFVWDAPLNTSFNKKWKMEEVFDNEDYFMRNYQLNKRILSVKDCLNDKKIVIAGYDLFRSSSEQFIYDLKKSGIFYIHLDYLNYPHRWDSRWILELLKHSF